MRTWTLAFLSGTLTLAILPELPPFYISVLLFCASLFLLLTARRARLAGVVLLGFVFAVARAELIFSTALDSSLEGETLVATGKISSLPEKRRHSIRFEFHIKSLVDKKGHILSSPGKIMLNWYSAPHEPSPGEDWRLIVRLKRPYGFRNPGGLDYEGWLFQHRILATGYVVKDSRNDLLGKAPWYSVHRIRQQLRQRISEALKDNHRMALVVALAIGDRSLIDKDDYRTLLDTGTNHLLAISGLHIGLVAILVYLASLRLFRYSGQVLNSVPAQSMAAVAAITSAALYALLAGMSISTQRALIMTVVFCLGTLGKTRYSMANIFFIAMVTVLFVDPFAILAPAFWLSFTAVAIILYGMRGRLGEKGIWWRWGRAQFLIAIGLLPLLLFMFQQYALAGFFANLVAIPWVSLVVVPLVLAGILLMPFAGLPSTFILKLAAYNLSVLWPILEYLQHLDFALLHGSSPSIGVLVLGLAGVFLILLPKGMPARWLGWVWLLPVILPYHDKPAGGEVWFTLLDVGQGLSAVIQTSGHVLVYDTGAQFSETFEAGSAVLIPYLRKKGIPYIDKVILSHGDNDHIGGANSLLEAMEYGTVMTSVPEKIAFPRIQKCHRGQHWEWDGVRFEILHPDRDKHYKSNNSSCVLMVAARGGKVLVTGDIEQNVERNLLKIYRNQLAAEVMTAPHHGSKTSSSPDFLDAVSPELVLFPVGYRNRFNFPNKDIIGRYRRRGIRSFDTARHGAILVKLSRNDIKVTSHRQQSRRFWHTEM